MLLVPSREAFGSCFKIFLANGWRPEAYLSDAAGGPECIAETFWLPYPGSRRSHSSNPYLGNSSMGILKSIFGLKDMYSGIGSVLAVDAIAPCVI